MELDMNKLREKRLNMPRQTSAEARAQFEKVQQDALRLYEMEKRKRSETSRVHET